ncbi:ABC transporter ATP-binding protein [Pseudotabrizicola alkalilacus]|uniref:ABC transporter ATP-binding protein n=1 Tax=Pseudotabrizicola alkalilacus TaxID=2305252 RepID=A0A411Z015_9RHOB|nr:ABC transporter ATP-binding protein [Pseudotabrizicola alkalilacus]RGP36409.1 ABC transporter ATP-binding protein [Pseudotabrizicola alkalilacus]
MVAVAPPRSGHRPASPATLAELERLTDRLSRKPAAHLQVESLSIGYSTLRGRFHAVEDISFEVPAGTNLGLVGESGCGKSTVVKTLMGLQPESTEVSGRALLDGRNILGLDENALRDFRWKRISLITQSAMNSLDPVYCIGDQISEAILAHEPVSKATAWARAEQMFALVGLPAGRLYEFPHMFSGGMRQRAVIAMALALNAGLLLADEPTTALDPIMQSQIMTRIRGIHAHMRCSMILVTHDIAVVAETCENIVVMYAGKVAESGPTADVLERPLHPYTMGLKNAFPRLPIRGEPRQPLISIPGVVPNLLLPPPGCRFASRCPFATEVCHSVTPPVVQVGVQRAACHHTDRAAEFRLAAARPDTWRNMRGAA